MEAVGWVKYGHVMIAAAEELSKHLLVTRITAIIGWNCKPEFQVFRVRHGTGDRPGQRNLKLHLLSLPLAVIDMRLLVGSETSRCPGPIVHGTAKLTVTDPDPSPMPRRFTVKGPIRRVFTVKNSELRRRH